MRKGRAWVSHAGAEASARPRRWAVDRSRVGMGYRVRDDSIHPDRLGLDVGLTGTRWVPLCGTAYSQTEKQGRLIGGQRQAVDACVHRRTTVRRRSPYTGAGIRPKASVGAWKLKPTKPAK